VKRERSKGKLQVDSIIKEKGRCIKGAMHFAQGNGDKAELLRSSVHEHQYTRAK
jgi:hypothetical protein